MMTDDLRNILDKVNHLSIENLNILYQQTNKLQNEQNNLNNINDNLSISKHLLNSMTSTFKNLQTNTIGKLKIRKNKNLNKNLNNIQIENRSENTIIENSSENTIIENSSENTIIENRSENSNDQLDEILKGLKIVKEINTEFQKELDKQSIILDENIDLVEKNQKDIISNIHKINNIF